MAHGEAKPLAEKVAKASVRGKSKETATPLGKKRGNVILDIDETFVQFVGLDDWATLSNDEQAKYETVKMSPTSTGLFILRPHIKEFFDFLSANCESVNLWTLSDQEYADGVKKMIKSKFGVNISHAWSEDANVPARKMYGHNKDLNWLWEKNTETKDIFKPCNTLLIDDLEENTQNPSNYRNGIRIPAFAPLGNKITASEGKTKTHIRTNKYTDFSTDRTLLDVINELNLLFRKETWCEGGDLPFPLGNERIDLTIGGRKTRRRKAVRKTRKAARKTKTRR